jgi:cell division septation protein DedD
MAKQMDYFRDEKGASARQLVLMFLAAVAVCAVFFSLGFVVGYNHAPAKAGPVKENVSPSGEIPPTVNPSSGGSSQTSSQGMETEKIIPESAAIPQPEQPATLQSKPAAKAQSMASRTVKKAAPKRSAESKPVSAPRTHATSMASTTADLHFAVQVMASKSKTDAGNLVKLLNSHGYPAYVLSPQQAHAKDDLFRVQVGPFASRVAADSTRDKLVGEGFRPFVLHF